jgi:hypothetical protein
MAIEFNCPHCGVLYKLKDEMAGKTGKCKNAKCQKPILIPYRSVVGTAGADAEALAAAAFSEEKPPAAAKAEGPTKKIAVTCQFCDHKFEADAAMGGKNTPCPECREIIRIPKLVEDKPADWRNTASGRPSLAKAAEPAPAGVWETQAKGVSGEALRKAGVLDVPDEEEPGERRIRRIKQACLGLAVLGALAFGVSYLLRSNRDSKQDRSMEKAVKEIDAEAADKPALRAAIQRFAGEYHVRAAKKNSEDLKLGVASFDKARDLLQNLEPESDIDRNGMLAELGVALVVCGGEGEETSENRRLRWDQALPLIRKCLDKIPPEESALRGRALCSLVRKLAEKNQAAKAVTIAQNICTEKEFPEMAGRIGIELFLMGKKDLAKSALDMAMTGEQQPALTALWLALNPEALEPPADVPLEKAPVKGAKGVTLEAIKAYAEGWALQGKFAEARAIAKQAGEPADEVELLTRIAAVAVATSKIDEAGKCIDEIVTLPLQAKESPLSPWLLVQAAELAARANKTEKVPAILDAMPPSARSWAQLGLLRMKLAAQPKLKAEDPAASEAPDLAQALMQSEVARHNIAAGESGYARQVDALPKLLRPFGYAGVTLGNQDRNSK